MSQNTDYSAVASSPSTNDDSRRILSHQYFVPTTSEFSISHNESFTPSSCAPSIVTDICVGSQNGVRNASTTMKIRENESPNDNQKYSFTLDLTSLKKDSNHTLKSQFYTFNMTTKDEENLHSSINTQLLNNHLLTPSSDHHDIDTLSDADTYIIEDDLDIAQDNQSEQKLNSSFKRYVNQKNKHRHGTFDIHGLISSTSHTIHRPVVDSNISTHDLSSSSSSSLHSFPDENDHHNIHKELEDTFDNKSSNILLQQQSTTSSKNKIKPAECFVISPTFERKSSPTTNIPRRKLESPWKSKLTTKSLPTKDSNLEISTTQSISPSLSAYSNQNSTEKYSIHLQKQSSPTKSPIQSHQTSSSSSFQRHSTTPENIQTSSSTINNDEITPNLTKVYMNKSFVLRRQHANLMPSTSKPLKPTTSITNSTGQTNRAVELRRARAQAKIEELSQRTKKQLHKTNHHNDIMSASWHSNATNTNKKDFTNLRLNPRTTVKTSTVSQRQEQTISSSSTSSNLLEEIPSRYRNPMISSVIDEQQYQRMSASTYSIEGKRCDSLRDNGQRLAIKLIQLSSGILEKLKSNDATIDNNVTMRELEKLVEKLQMVNQTLTSIDAALTGPINDKAFV